MKSKACLYTTGGLKSRDMFKVCAGQTFNIGLTDVAKIVSATGKHSYKIKSVVSGKTQTVSYSKLSNAIIKNNANRKKFRITKKKFWGLSGVNCRDSSGAFVPVPWCINRPPKGMSDLSGVHCRDSSGAFVPVPWCTGKRLKRSQAL
jgi:hypothetical protein